MDKSDCLTPSHMDLCDNYASKMFQRKKSVLITQLMKPWTEEAYSLEPAECSLESNLPLEICNHITKLVSTSGML